MSKYSTLTLVIIILIVTFFFSKFIVREPNLLIIGFILSILVFFISFFSPDIGLLFLIFSMLLSPEIKLAEVPGREVVIRIDDLLVFSVFFGWFMQSVFVKKLEIVVTKLLLPIFVYTLIYFVSTILGIFTQEVVINKAFFYLLKYTEYFVIYFLVTNIVKSRKQVIVYILCFFITAIVVNLHGYSLIGKVDRLYAPFDTPEYVIGSGQDSGAGEANTYGGYLVIIISLALSFFCYLKSVKKSLLILIFIIFSLVPLAYTLSRSSYLAFIVMVITTIFFTEHKKIFLIMSLIISIMFIIIFMPKVISTVSNRINETFTGPNYSSEEFVIMGIKIRELSALARVDAWRRAFVKFLPNKPILGHGITGVGLVDTQIPLIIGEVGLVGLFTFFWLIFTIYKESFIIFKTTKDNIFKALSLFQITILTALLAQSIGANTFIIVRIMEPFWFLCGITMMAKVVEN